MFTRFSRTVSRPLVVSFFTQRHPQAKSSITEKMAEWMEDNHELAAMEFGEFEESISSEFISFSNSLRNTGRRTQRKKRQINIDPGTKKCIH